MQNAYVALNKATGRYEIRWTVRENGRSNTKIIRTGATTRDEALADLEGMRAGEQLKRELLETPTVNDILDAYSERLERRGSAETTKITVQHLRRHLGHVRVSQIDQERIDAYADERGVADPTIRRELGSLRAAFNVAIKARKLRPDDVNHFELPAGSVPREVFLDPEERAAFIAKAMERGSTDRLTVFVFLALHLGQRMQSILDLTWDRVNFKTGLVDCRTPHDRVTKKRKCIVPMSPKLRAFLEEIRPHATSEYVCYHNGDVSQTYGRWVATTEWAHVHIHDLRRTFATNLLLKGVAITTVAGLIGDRPETMLRTYAHYVPGAAAEAVLLLD